HWRLHIVILIWTFAIFPILAWMSYPALLFLLGDDLAAGVIYLCVLPGTVQSAVAFTSMARGNVPAAVCAASASSVLGIVLTPLLLGFLLGADTSILSNSALFASVRKISLQILLPFVLGHAMRPIVGRWMDA